MEKSSDVIARVLLTLLTMIALIPASAQPQNGPIVSTPPSLDVIGFYSLSADAAAYTRFIQNQIAFHDPANFSEENKALFRRLGRGDSLHPFTDDDRRGWEEHLRSHMDEAAAFEVMVTNPDASFDISKFLQPNPSQPENFWQVAWNTKFLTPDGETLIDLNRAQKLPDLTQYRIVFVIHFWKPNQPLRSSYGELALPVQHPLPERLWRLTPYEVPD